MATTPDVARIEAVTEPEARHLGAMPVDGPPTVQAHVLPGRVHHLFGRAQAFLGISGAVAGAAILGALGLLIESTAWLPPGFAATTTADGFALFLGGVLAGAGVGGLTGATIGMVLDLRSVASPVTEEDVVVVPASNGAPNGELRQVKQRVGGK